MARIYWQKFADALLIMESTTAELSTVSEALYLSQGILKFFTRKIDICSRVTVMVGQYFLGVTVQP
jgi:hypothetical protein